MKTRKLGKNGPEVSAMGLGCMGMSDFYGSRSEAESLQTLDTALGLGCNFWDTSDMYGPHTNEQLLAKALKGRRKQVFLATKFGIVRLSDKDPMQRGFNGSPAYVAQACDASLLRLEVDTIDLYYLHRVDPATPIEETVGAMAKLVKAGKIRHIGLSEAGVATLERASSVHPIAALQTEYSLWSRDLEAEIIPACRRLGIGMVPYSPLGRGFLTGRFQKPEDFEEGDYRRFSPRFQGENFGKNLKLAALVAELAAAKGCKPSQLALAWVLAQGEDIVPIPGTKKSAYLKENWGALDLSFRADELKKIEEVFPLGAAAGLRYPEAMMKFTNF